MRPGDHVPVITSDTLRVGRVVALTEAAHDVALGEDAIMLLGLGAGGR